jgi:hypothetical protein
MLNYSVNDKQKIFVIIGTMSLGYWLFFPMSFGHPYTIFEIFEDFDVWFRKGHQVMALAVSIGCAVGFKLFKDK